MAIPIPMSIISPEGVKYLKHGSVQLPLKLILTTDDSGHHGRFADLSPITLMTLDRIENQYIYKLILD
jgi:hypothetical protein